MMALRRARISNALTSTLVMVSVIALSAMVLGQAAASEQAEQVVVLKSKRLLMLLSHGRVLKAWRISLGENPIGPKQTEGDGRTPEGLYFVDGRIPDSRFHLSLHLSYPNEADILQARAAHESPGSNIAIHGLPDDYPAAVASKWLGDWTDGCIAVDNRAIEMVWQSVDVGTPVTIFP